MTLPAFLLILVCIGLSAWLVSKLAARTTVYEFQKGLRYSRGRFTRLLGPGLYWHCPLFTQIEPLDVREQATTIKGQEVLSKDGVTLKVSLAARFRVADPALARHTVADHVGAMYLELQTALRREIGDRDMDDVLATRGDMGKAIHEVCREEVARFGVDLLAVELKDIMFPGSLKELYARELQARKEGLAALERARGESAALRHLANAAKMLENNPKLMNLRILQVLEGSSGNTVVLDMSGNGDPAITAPKKGKDA